VGWNFLGFIGDGTNINCYKIKKIEYFKNIFIVDIACGDNHCLSISNKGDVFSWGWGESGQIGNGKCGWDVKQLTPIKIFKI
jgi:alpha-tubulin suppressor-like RCC1 family protein